MTDPSPHRPASGDPVSALVARYAHGDRSLAHALAAVFDAANADGAAPLHVVATRYRDVLLARLQGEGRDSTMEASRLSLDEVRAHLATSLLPTLSERGAIVWDSAVGQQPDAPVTVSPALWLLLSSRRVDVSRALKATGEHATVGRPSLAGTAPPDVAAAPMANPSVLSAEGLVKVYRGRRVVHNVALRVAQGEIVGLLGPNGAGKTTTFYMLVGLIAPQAGKIQLDGRDITNMPMYQRARAGIGYLSQEPSIFRKLTVEQNITAILETLPLSADDRAARLETLLDELGIKRLRQSRAFQLSGGERRRLEITRALVTEPKFMMLDEPFAGVDPIAVHDIQSIVSDLRHRGIGVLISDHNVEQTLDIVDRAYIMFDGQVKVSGTVRELVFDDTVAEIYLGPTLTTRLRARFAEADEGVVVE